MRRKPFPRRNDESSGGNVLILSSILNDGTGPLALFFLRRSIGLHSPGNFPGTQVITFSSREYISRSPSSIGLKGNCVSARLFSLLGKIARTKKCGAPFSLFNRLIGKFIGSVLTSSHHAWTGTTFAASTYLYPAYPPYLLLFRRVPILSPPILHIIPTPLSPARSRFIVIAYTARSPTINKYIISDANRSAYTRYSILYA